MISPPKFQTLIDILEETKSSFDEIFQKSQLCFPSSEHPSLSTTLKLLIKDKFLHNSQKIAALYLIYTIEKDNLTIGLSNLEPQLENFIKQLPKLDVSKFST